MTTMLDRDSLRELAAALAQPAPRLLGQDQLCAYLGGITPSTLWRWVKAGTIPRPIAGTTRWDRTAVDLALDQASGLGAPAADGNDDPFLAALNKGNDHAHGQSSLPANPPKRRR